MKDNRRLYNNQKEKLIMNEKQLDKEKIAEMYNKMVDIWPKNDKWYSYTYKNIANHITNYKYRNNFNEKSLILNVGSAGNEYGISGKHYHVDIAAEKLTGIENSFLISAEKLPFEDEIFDGGLCVGSVINYCDPFAVIGEISRTLKRGASFVIDFEQSNSWQFIGTDNYNSDASIITSFNSGINDDVWIFSYRHIKNILNSYNFIIQDELYFHLLTPLFYKIFKNEQRAANFTKLDPLIRLLPFFNKKSCNIILTIQKV
jgi:ubiquinone/menaquinone biosynthesis C-methylase UbiE